MQTLYTYTGVQGPEFVIRYSQGRSYRCYSLTDPDLYKPCKSSSDLRLPYHTYTQLATADYFTLDLVKDQFPEYFI